MLAGWLVKFDDGMYFLVESTFQENVLVDDFIQIVIDSLAEHLVLGVLFEFIHDQADVLERIVEYLQVHCN